MDNWNPQKKGERDWEEVFKEIIAENLSECVKEISTFEKLREFQIG